MYDIRTVVVHFHLVIELKCAYIVYLYCRYIIDKKNRRKSKSYGTVEPYSNRKYIHPFLKFNLSSSSSSWRTVPCSGPDVSASPWSASATLRLLPSSASSRDLMQPAGAAGESWCGCGIDMHKRVGGPPCVCVSYPVARGADEMTHDGEDHRRGTRRRGPMSARSANFIARSSAS